MLAKKLLSMPDCTVCSKYGGLMCERCGETYCSRECQVADWREHRKICMPLPRLLSRPDVCESVYQINQVNQVNRMLMGAPTNVNGFDSIDATATISENSMHGDSGAMTQEQIKNLTTKLEKIQLEQAPKGQTVDSNANLTGIEDVLGTPPVTPQKKRDNENGKIDVIQTEQVSKASKIDDKASSVCTEASVVSKKPSASFRLVPPAKKTKNYKPWVQQIQAKIHVILVNIEDHQTVFVIPSCEIKHWETLIRRIEEYAPSAKPLQKPPQVGYVVLAKPKSSESYARAWVKKINVAKSVAKVEFLEYGCTDIIQFDEMKCLTEELVNVPRLVNAVTLKGVPDTVPHSNVMIKYLTKLQEHQVELIVQHFDLIEKSELTVHCSATLVTSDKFMSINEEIMRLTPAEVEKEKEKVEEDLNEVPKSAQAQDEAQANRLDIEFKPICGKNLKLFIIDNSLMNIGYFSAIEDATSLAKNDAIINENTNLFVSEPPFFPRDGEMCLAQSSDGRWYRASSQGKEGDSYQLLYLDYGNMELVHSDKIREMREEFIFPCLTSLCYIDGLDGKLTPKVVDCLQELIQPFSEFTFDEVFNKGEDVYCKSEEILQFLKQKQLI